MRAVGRLGAMQARAQTLMQDTFTAYAPAAWEKVDGLDVEVQQEQYATVGKVAGRSRQGGDTSSRTVSLAGVESPVLEGGLHIPLSAGLPEIGWEFVCTAVGGASDSSLVGRRWRVVDVPAKSFATARRLDVVEVVEVSELTEED